MVLEGSTSSFERIHRTGIYNPSEDSAGNKLFLVLQRLHTENRGWEPDSAISDSWTDTFVLPEGKRQKVYKIFPDTITKNQLISHLKAISLACGIRIPLGYHVARHSFGTLALGAGIPMESIAKMMGHASISSTQIYAQITDPKIARNMDRLIQ